MEKEKWKIRLCVLLVVLIAIVVGLIYYLQYIRPTNLTEGVLISIMGELPEGLESYGTK